MTSRTTVRKIQVKDGSHGRECFFGSETGYGVACACELGSLVPTDHFGSQKHVHFAAQNRCSSLPAGKSQMTTAWFAHKCM